VEVRGRSNAVYRCLWPAFSNTSDFACIEDAAHGRNFGDCSTMDRAEALSRFRHCQYQCSPSLLVRLAHSEKHCPDALSPPCFTLTQIGIHGPITV
jgi:hypothetical protein